MDPVMKVELNQLNTLRWERGDWLVEGIWKGILGSKAQVWRSKTVKFTFSQSVQLLQLSLDGWRMVGAGEEMVEAVQSIGDFVYHDEELDLVLWGQCGAITRL